MTFHGETREWPDNNGFGVSPKASLALTPAPGLGTASR